MGKLREPARKAAQMAGPQRPTGSMCETRARWLSLRVSSRRFSFQVEILALGVGGFPPPDPTAHEDAPAPVIPATLWPARGRLREQKMRNVNPIPRRKAKRRFAPTALVA